MSEVNPFDVIDYLAVARTRVTQQFKSKDIFDRYLQLLLSGQQDMEPVIKDVMQKRSIDTATGIQLDNIGELVGQPRSLVIYGTYDYFGFDTDVGSFPFSSNANPSAGGTWLSDTLPVAGNIELDDNTYRLVIKARILANSSSCRPQDIINSAKFLLGTDTATYSEPGNAHITLGLGRTLTELEKYLIKGQGGAKGLIPIPAGVSIDFYEYDETGVFGFNEDPTALGFADLQTVTTTIGYGESYGDSYGGGTGGTSLVLVGGGTFASII